MCVWRVACGVWRVACSVWRVACGVWREACGVWRVEKCGAACDIECGVGYFMQAGWQAEGATQLLETRFQLVAVCQACLAACRAAVGLNRCSWALHRRQVLPLYLLYPCQCQCQCQCQYQYHFEYHCEYHCEYRSKRKRLPLGSLPPCLAGTGSPTFVVSIVLLRRRWLGESPFRHSLALILAQA